jgi:GT2 family glycosyltransferase
MDPHVSIILLSYARPAMLAESLRAACAQSYARREIIVVDNDSDRSAEIVQIVAAASATHPELRIVRTGGNHGFATGMNRGIQEARGEFALLTEDDMVLAPDATARFVAAALAGEADGTTRALYSGVIRDGDTGTVLFAGGALSLDTVLGLHIWHENSMAVDVPAEFATEYVTGAFVFGRTRLLRETGGYRDDFFMYFEDVELCLRARRRGIVLRMIRDAWATHFTPPPGGASAFMEFHKRKNLLATYLLHAPWRVVPVALLRYGVLDTIRGTSSRTARGVSVRVGLRALAWVAGNVVRLLRDRRRLAA